MKRHALILVALLGLSASSRAQTPLKLEQTIPLPGLKEGDFDHFAVDLAGQLLFLTAEKNAAVEVFDFQTNKLVHTITGLDEPHSMLYRADLKKLFVVDGGAAEIKMYEGESYAKLGAIKLEDDCDSFVYVPATKYLYVVNSGKGAHQAYSLISIIDTTAARKIACLHATRCGSLRAFGEGARKLFASAEVMNRRFPRAV